MEARRRVQKRKANERLQARQTSASPSSTQSFLQPTARVALTSAFDGPSTCAENLLTMLPPPTYQIWANEPVPVQNNTIAACYPSEFLQSYTAVSVSVGTSLIPSSIVPAMSPFACPKNYCTAMAASKNYIVCCPNNYKFHPPDSTVDPSRPFYGGTCYSEMAHGSTFPVIQYNSNGDSASAVFQATNPIDQAYAHPIDGYALTSPTALGCMNPSSGLASNNSSGTTTSNSTTSLSNSSAPASNPGLSGGAIAGIVIGSLVGLAAIVGAIFFLLFRLKKQKRSSNSDPSLPPDSHNQSPLSEDQMLPVEKPDSSRHEANNAFSGLDISSTPKEIGAHERGWKHNELNEGYGAFEMPADHAVEMDSGWSAVEKDGVAVTPVPIVDPANKRTSTAKVLDKHERERNARSANWN